MSDLLFDLLGNIIAGAVWLSIAIYSKRKGYYSIWVHTGITGVALYLAYLAVAFGFDPKLNELNTRLLRGLVAWIIGFIFVKLLPRKKNERSSS
jgi:hypothetical protein